MLYVIESLKKIFGSAENILNKGFSNYGIDNTKTFYFTKGEYEKWRKEVLSKPLP